MSFDTIQFRRGTAAAWTSANPTLSAGEPGMETDTDKFKIGDGATPWNSLAYQGGSGAVSSVFTRTGAVVAANGDYTPAQVGAVPTAALPSTGGSSSPASGTWTAGQMAYDTTDRVWQCTASGTPGTWQLAGTAGSSGALTLISRHTFSANANSYTFSSIPGTYTDLILNINAQISESAGNGLIGIQFNGDTAAHYDYMVAFYGAGTWGNNASGSPATALAIAEAPGSTATATEAGATADVVIPYYASTTDLGNKIASSQGMVSQGTLYTVLGTGDWRSSATTAITSVTVLDIGGGNILAGSVVSLFGRS